MHGNSGFNDILLAYQQHWFADVSKVRVWEKSRRIGAFYVEALCAVYYAALTKKDGGTNTYYLSYNKEMTQQFIKDCAFWAEKINGVVAIIDEVIIRDEEKDVTVYRIRFESGNEIWGLPSKPHSLHSKQGRVVIDEAAFCEDLPQLIKDYGDGADEELFCIPTASGQRYFSGDLTVYWAIEELPNGDTRTVCVIELRNVPFMNQCQFIQMIVDALGKQFDGAAFDSRGNGQMIAELAAQEWPGLVFQVMLSRKWYAENFPQLKQRLEEQTTSIPDDKDIKDDFGVVKIHQGIPLIAERTGEAKSRRHGDGVVAFCLADFAMRESDSGWQPMTYEAVGTPNRFRAIRGDSWDD